MTKRGQYTFRSTCVLSVITVCLAIAMHLWEKNAMIVPIVVLGIFFCAANTCSLYVRDMFQPSKSNTITTFYLIDKTVRFLASIMLFGVLIYIYKDNGLILGITSFTYYIIAMALELSYFFAIERKNRIQNA